MLQTEFSFVLPCGYVDEQGNLHREGSMRRATAIDEIEPLEDPRVQRNEAYLSILLLSRVITRLAQSAPLRQPSWSACSQPIFSTCKTCTFRSTPPLHTWSKRNAPHAERGSPSMSGLAR